MAKRSKNVDHFDPSDQETVELVTPDETPASAWVEDTIADPVGVEERNTPTSIQLPDYYFRKYALDAEGKPTFQASRVKGIMEVFESKKGTPIAFMGNDDKAKKKEQDYFDSQVEQVALGLQPLLETDPQSTGINFLQLTTRTWAEFASIAWEYQDDATNANPNEELPTWLIEREEKMFGLGRKARMLSAVTAQVDDKFGLSNLSLSAIRVQTEVERRQQRLAEWNYNNCVDMSVKVASDLNKATVEHTQSVFAVA